MNRDESGNKDASIHSPHNVLLAVAEEKFGFAIADFVSKHNWPANTKFYLLYVVEEPLIKRWITFSPEFAQQIIHEDEVYGSQLIQHVENYIRRSIPAAQIERHVVHGYAKNEILDRAKNIKADLIVVGTHGRTGLASLLLGSVATAVITHADCSVLTVRIPANQFREGIDMNWNSKDLPEQMLSYRQ